MTGADKFRESLGTLCFVIIALQIFILVAVIINNFAVNRTQDFVIRQTAGIIALEHAAEEAKLFRCA